jgi:hypothetical protein
MRIKYFSYLLLAITAARLLSCNGDNATQTQGPPSGTWTGLITYNNLTGICSSSSEVITVSVSETEGGQVTARFSSACYTNAKFTGQASAGSLTGQLQTSVQTTCRNEDGFSDNEAKGQSSGSFDASHIHLETPDLGNADCDFGGNVIDIDRSH